MTNRLADATSPYLLQHAENPVDWWPWSPEAFAEATSRDVPVLLSVGYAACHWCHVMAHESFENPALAAVINAGFVPVKVDREERPDVDAVYMTATQAMTGQGGWPMTVFLTPDGRPFYAGTYYPPEPRGGLPGFGQLLEALAGAWQDQRTEVLESASTITAAIAATAEAVTGDEVPVRQWPAVLDAAAAALLDDYDAARGGFGGAPKFPPAMACQFLLRHHRRTGDPDALAAVEGTLTGMAGGGLYDQLAGGFARYSVDAGWVVPHFEKMLYDNALLLRCYAEHARTTGSPASRRVCEQTVDFLLDRLRLAGGGFAASLDADTAGVEGLTYVWTPAELAEVLGPLDGAWVAELCEVTAAGTFEHGASVLQLRREPDDPRRWADCRRRLLAARDARPQPALDDKVLLSWNGLTVGALAEAGAVLDRPDWVAAARAAADDLASRHLVDGRWRRASRDGRPADAQATLADLADFADGLLALHQACGARRYLDLAGDLLDLALARFADAAGGFFDTSDDAERLVVRPRDVADGATPAGASGLVRALLTHAALTGDTEHRAVADRELGRMLPLLGRFPRSAGHWLTAAEEALTGPIQVAVVGPDAAALLGVARAAAPAGTVFAVGDGTDDRGVELLRGRGAAGRPALAFVCHGFVCALPTADPAELRTQLRG